jgi:hypothetical protein
MVLEYTGLAQVPGSVVQSGIRGTGVPKNPENPQNSPISQQPIQSLGAYSFAEMPDFPRQFKV